MDVASILKIVHLQDMAGVAATLSHYLHKMGHTSVVYNDASIDNLRIGEYYKTQIDCTSLKLVDVCTNLNETDVVDRVFLHDAYGYVEHMDRDFDYVFHGNQLRAQPKLYDLVSNHKHCRNIWISTPDLHLLTKGNAILLTRPIDTELFKWRNLTPNDDALCITQERFQKQVEGWKMNFMPDSNFHIKYRDQSLIKYESMPTYLYRFRQYIDLKYQPSHPPKLIKGALSQNALQALSCGLKVIDGDNWTWDEFPVEHEGGRATREFISKLKI